MRTMIGILRIFTLPLVSAIVIALVLRENCFRLFSIPSESMEPALSSGDHVAVTPYRSLFRQHEPQRGDVVVFRRHGTFFVKRVIAAPGDLIEVRDNRVRVNGRALHEPYLAGRVDTPGATLTLVPAAEYFVMGDQRGDSVDSRDWGTLPREAIWGRARLIFWSDGGRRTITEPAVAESTQPSTGSARRIRWQRIGASLDAWKKPLDQISR